VFNQQAQEITLIIIKEEEMLRKFFLIGALCICAVAILVIDAYAVPICPAGTAWSCKYPGGRRICTCWSVGSTNCAGTVQAVDEGWFKCEIYGTYPDKKNWCGDGLAGDPKDQVELQKDEFDPDCLVPVFALCGPKKCAKDWTQPGCIDNVSWESSHYQKDEIPLEVDELTCKKGNCKSLITFLEGEGVCRPGHVVLTAFAVYFNAQGCFCDTVFNDDGTCPNDQDGVWCVDTFEYVDPFTVEEGDPYTSEEDARPVPSIIPYEY
jgi:hypothetical protein